MRHEYHDILHELTQTQSKDRWLMKNALYNFFIHEVTMLCYRNCLQYFAPGSHILDVGIGNGVMIRAFHEFIRSKNLSITGIDINRCYLDHCSNQIRKWGLEQNITVLHEPVETYEPPEKHWFDSILFSMSFMLLEDPEMVLDRIGIWLKPGGRILFFQTMFRNHSFIMELVKPRLKYLTSIDFGRVIYSDAFFKLLKRKGLEIEEDRLISKKWFAGEYRLIISAMDSSVTSVIRNRPMEEKINPHHVSPSRSTRNGKTPAGRRMTSSGIIRS